MRAMRLLRVGLVLTAGLAAPVAGSAAPITFSGTVTYTGPYAADTLYVAVVDVDTVSFVIADYDAVPAGSPPLSLPYSLTFESSGVVGSLMIGALLDADGSGFDPASPDTTVTNPDVVGWYDGKQDPLLLAPDSSRAGLDFALPTAEIHGSLTFAAGQTWAEVAVTADLQDYLACRCEMVFHAPGSYSVLGLYSGDWFVVGFGPGSTICYGDPSCTNPSVITLTEGEIRTGVDLDFSAASSVRATSWGGAKARYR